MELDHLRVVQPDARLISERHAVTGADIAVGGKGIHAAHTASGQDHRLGGNCIEPAAPHVDRHHADAPSILYEELGHERFVVAMDLGVLEGGLEYRMQHVEAGLVSGEASAPCSHPTERSDRDLPIRVPAPRAT